MEAEQAPAEQYRKRAAKTRDIAKTAKSPALLEHLESIAREYDEIADELEAVPTETPTTD